MLIFQIQSDPQIGPGSWKMNSSIIRDALYRNEIEELIHDLNSRQIANPLDWWDLFIAVVQGTTISYSKEKAGIKNSLKNFLVARIQSLEELDDMNYTQKQNYDHYKWRLDDIIFDEIRGHEIN